MDDVPKNLICASVRPIGGLQENAMFTKALASTALLMGGPARMVLIRASVNQVCLFSNPVYTSFWKSDVNLVRIGSFFSERNLFSDLFRSLSSAKASISVAGIKRKVISTTGKHLSSFYLFQVLTFAYNHFHFRINLILASHKKPLLPVETPHKIIASGFSRKAN